MSFEFTTFGFQGFVLSVNVDAIIHTLQTTDKTRYWSAMNLSASFLAERYMKEWDKVMPYVDILFGNETVSQTRLFQVLKLTSQINLVHTFMFSIDLTFF